MIKIIKNNRVQMEIECYTDGACSGNNRASDYSPGGWGWVIYDKSNQIVQEKYGGEARTTNSRMEIYAILNLCEYLCGQPQYKSVKIYSDNNYCVNTLGNPVLSGWIKNWMWNSPPYKGKANPDLWKIIVTHINKLRESGVEISIHKVKGHAGIPGNERADDLANKGMDVYK